MPNNHKLEDVIRFNLNNRLKNDHIDLRNETESLLNDIGASLSEFGGTITFYGKDPIIPSVLRYGSFSAISLAAKAAQIASIWKIKTGEPQDINVDVRKALRRFACFYEGDLETVNGRPGDTNAELGSAVQTAFYKSKDNKWVFFTCPYPRLRNNALTLLKCAPDENSVKKAVAQWNAEELEKAAESAGAPIYLVRSPDEFMKLDVFQKVLKHEPLIKIEKVADSKPIPFSEQGDALHGIKALGLGHVIAGAAVGRALALHGADVLNVWLKNDYEHSLFHYTSNVGHRSVKLDIKGQEEDKKKFDELLAGADIFFSNRRGGFLERYHLSPHELTKKFPGLITATVYFSGEEGAWSKHVGFDISTGAFGGAYWLESLGGTYRKTNEPHLTPKIAIISDYVVGWLTTVGVLEALKRRAKDGGSYKVSVSLGRVLCWLLSLGVFDQEYAYNKANSDEEHAYVMPEPILGNTPMGYYRGVAEQVEMSKTPGHYKYLLEPLFSSLPEWDE
ncbi:CoA transferase [Serratia surfactantfaciens]|uniref:CoA transferase n=1 Tax=Serratia surfactantfaciens TaxID=2741499 RepID=UPI003EDFC50D